MPVESLEVKAGKKISLNLDLSVKHNLIYFPLHARNNFMEEKGILPATRFFYLTITGNFQDH